MQKGFAHIFALVGVLVVVLVVGEIYYFGKVKSSKDVQQTVDMLLTPRQAPDKQESKGNFLPVPSVATKQPEFNDYSNLDLGFKFSYGNDLSVITDSEEEFNRRGNGNFRKNFTGYVGYEPPQFLGAAAVLNKDNSFDNNPFTLWVFNNDNNLKIEQWFDKYWYYPFLWGVFDHTSKGHIALDKEATVSGETAKSRVVSYQTGQPKYIYAAKNSKMYLFRILDDSNKIGDQILSTFKFLQ